MIRPAIFADMWALRRKPRRRIFFYTDALLASSYHPYLLALHSILGPLGSRSGQATLVLRNPKVRGYLQARRRPGKAEIDVQFLAAYGAGARAEMSDGDIFFQLLEGLLARAGGQQIERVFATVGRRADDLLEVLRQLMFQPYAQQSVWLLAEPSIEAGSAMVALRRQNRRDAWPLHQLYLSLAPRHVQQAELRESTSWQLSRTHKLWGGRERAWVLGDDQSLQVYVRLQTGSRGHVLHLMVAPHLRGETAAMVRYVLSQIHDQQPVFAVVRSYQGELQAAMQELGFVERGEQTLYVRRLALRERQSSFVPALLRVEQREGAMSLSTATEASSGSGPGRMRAEQSIPEFPPFPLLGTVLRGLNGSDD